MSDLNDMVRVYVGDADVVTVPLVDNLTASNAAPKASTVGAALAEKVDTETIMEHVTITFNEVQSDNQGVILATAEDIPIDDTQGADDIKTYVDAIGAKTAEDIVYESGETATIKTVVDALAEDIEDVADNLFASEIKMSSTDTTTVSEKISAIDGKTAADIPYGAGSNVGAALGSMAESISSLQNGQTGTVKVSSQTFTDGEQTQARSNIGAAARAETVLVNEAQSLNVTQQAQARANIGAAGSSEAVLITEQTLTSAQQTQARTNIGAASETDMSQWKTVVTEQVTMNYGLTAQVKRIGKVCMAEITGQTNAAASQWAAIGSGFPHPVMPVIVPNCGGPDYINLAENGVLQTGGSLASGAYVLITFTYITSD